MSRQKRVLSPDPKKYPHFTPEPSPMRLLDALLEPELPKRELQGFSKTKSPSKKASATPAQKKKAGAGAETGSRTPPRQVMKPLAAPPSLRYNTRKVV